MANQKGNKEQQNDKTVADSLKNTAGSAFETMHNALETVENIAMSTVDATTKATSNFTGKTKDKRNNQ